MATNGWNTETDDYDIFSLPGDTVTGRPGSPELDENGHLVVDTHYFPMSTTPQSMMDQDPNNTGPTNDFFTEFPISIDINGYIFYNGENTGINVRGPAGFSHLSFDELTPEQIASLKGADGADGADGINGLDGRDGENGYSAYEVWLADNGWLDHPELHPVSDFFQYIADLANAIVIAGVGTGSIILNYVGANSTASGAGATAIGQNTNASGLNSIAAGLNTNAGYSYQTVFGKFNDNKSINAIEVGNGNTNLSRKNIFELTWSGDLQVFGDITDGRGNVLKDKVTKEEGKGLSSNDFTDSYKNFIDNYTVDTEISALSTNPVTNSAIAIALAQVAEAGGKPTQGENTESTDIGFLQPTIMADGTMNAAWYSTDLTWNEQRKVLKTRAETGSYNNIFAFGNNLAASADNQLIFGKYNEPKSADVIEIGYGTASNNRKNILELTNAGNLTTAGTITDGLGNILSNKQNLLSWDSEPTENSTNVVRSGDLYDYLVAHGINPSGGLNIPEIPILQAQVAALIQRVTILESLVAAIGNPREIPDDTYNQDIYRIGIDKGEFYIQLIEDEQEVEEDGDDTEQNSTE